MHKIKFYDTRCITHAKVDFEGICKVINKHQNLMKFSDCLLLVLETRFEPTNVKPFLPTQVRHVYTLTELACVNRKTVEVFTEVAGDDQTSSSRVFRLKSRLRSNEQLL